MSMKVLPKAKEPGVTQEKQLKAIESDKSKKEVA